MAHKTSRRIDGSALESIMLEVLQGMQDFTSEACQSGDTAAMEIIAVERPGRDLADTADIIAFPGKAG
ncbi:MAG: hypothetical protein WBO34_07350 [Gammaproteobacteria bacterium]